MPFSVVLMRSQALYWAAQVYSTRYMVRSMQYSKKTEEGKKQGEKNVKKKIAGRLLTQAVVGFLQLTCFLCAHILDDIMYPVCT